MRDDIKKNLEAILRSPTYRLSELDTDFFQSEEMRPVRMQLELLKPELALKEERVNSTIVVFGGTQIVEKEHAKILLGRAEDKLAQDPKCSRRLRAVDRAKKAVENASFYDAAREFGKLVTKENRSKDGQPHEYVITTGGGPGIMEAANQGAYEAGGKSMGLNITLPAEQAPNPYITPSLCFQFHYFAIRKMHFLLRAKALVVFPGGFGTLDELFDALTLRQTHRMQEIPIILFSKDYWTQVINFDFLKNEGVIEDKDLDLIDFAETASDAWKIISRFHRQPKKTK